MVQLALLHLLGSGLRAVVPHGSQGHLQRHLLMPPEATQAPLAAASSRAACTLHGGPARVTDKKHWVSTLVLPTLGPKRLVVVVVVVLTGDFTNVFVHARKWVHLIMGEHVPVDMTSLTLSLCTRP